MKIVVLRCLLLMVLIMGSGCAVGQKIDLNHISEPVTKVENPLTVAVSVQDLRPYITNGDKELSFIGIYRAGFGNTWDVRTKDKVAFAEIVKKDLIQSLRQAGFTVQDSGAERTVDIGILDYNFDCYINCRAWHKFSVTVRDAHGAVVASTEIMDENTVQGSAWSGPKGAMETELPKIYGDVIARLVLRNKDVLPAITSH